jgi:hypothetical protein
MWNTIRQLLERREFSLCLHSDQVLSEEWFSLHLTRERARSNRTGDPFLLVMISIDSGGDSVRRVVEEAVLERTRLSDAKGWLDGHLGVLLPGARVEEVPTIVRSLEEVIAEKLEKRGIKVGNEKLLVYKVYSYPWTKEPAGVFAR